MSRWLHRLSSSSTRRSLEEGNVPKQQAQASNHTHNHVCPGYPTTTANWTLLRLNKALHDREEELSDRSYQLLIQKLQLSENETILAQRYEDLIRERTVLGAAMEGFQDELQSLAQQWQEIQATKSKLVAQHERLEAAIEAIAVDKDRLAEEYQVQFSVQ